VVLLRRQGHSRRPRLIQAGMSPGVAQGPGWALASLQSMADHVNDPARLAPDIGPVLDIGAGMFLQESEHRRMIAIGRIALH